MLILQLRCLYADLVKQTFTSKNNKEYILKKERKKERERERERKKKITEIEMRSYFCRFKERK